MKKLYIECKSGISGDMTVAALLDLGADKEILQNVLNTIPLKNFKTEIRRVQKNGIDVCDFNVILEEDNHDHDMNYLYGHEHEEHHHQSENHPHHHHHHSDEKHHHEHRGLTEIKEIIANTKMTENAKKLALSIFTILAEAESKAHNKPINEVHFHEVGAVDSIVDIISIAVCFDNLNINDVIVPELYEGTGTVRCQHGILPVPVPAVCNIVSAYNLPLKFLPDKGEFITPTGAAFIASVKTSLKLPEKFTIQKIGMGAGKRNYERPNLLRIFLIETEDKNTTEELYKLETNIDDCTGESLGFVMEELLINNALDVHYIPCFMKKNRPAWLLTILCEEKDVQNLEQIVFKNTTTIGIRKTKIARTKLTRKKNSVQTEFGSVEAKQVVLPDGTVRNYPEYESVSSICRNKNVSFWDVYNKAINM